MTLLDESSTCEQELQTSLRRTLTLPWLVFYGVGITVGAGIFALIGEILGTSGPRSPIAFLVAGAIAAVTGFAYRDLVAFMPRAGGEAIWVRHGLGRTAGRATGAAVVLAGVVSSAVVALAFGGYVSEVAPLHPKLAALTAVAVLVTVAMTGARSGIAVAGVVTLLEVGALLVIIIYGIPVLDGWDSVTVVTTEFDGGTEAVGFLESVLAGATLAFFAFIGFEDVANMAEETVDPRKTMPRAITLTLAISVAIYVLLSLIAVNVDDPSAIAESDAPMATLFESVSGLEPEVMASIAAVAMTNGILAQVMMSSRVLFGMGTDGELGALSHSLSTVHRRFQTPTTATATVGLTVAALVTFVPLLRLARVTSLLVLLVFLLVNLSQARLTRRNRGGSGALGLTGALMCGSLFLWQSINILANV